MRDKGDGAMRGVWWSALLLGGLIGGIAGAAIIFGLTQAFGGPSGSSRPAAARGVRAASTTTDSLTARNGLDAEAIYNRVHPSTVIIDTKTLRTRSRQEGEGTGIVLDTAGHILTNNHVIEGVTQIQVTTADGKTFTGDVLATDPDHDLAVIHVAGGDALQPVILGDPSTLHVGQPVLALGNPLGYEATLTEGIISGLDRTFDDGQTTPMSHLIQSDAAINPGNSGGPLLNGNGEVVGINTLLDNPDGGSSFSGLGFAVPIDEAQGVLKRAGVTAGK